MKKPRSVNEYQPFSLATYSREKLFLGKRPEETAEIQAIFGYNQAKSKFFGLNTIYKFQSNAKIYLNVFLLRNGRIFSATTHSKVKRQNFVQIYIYLF